jgi:hypothetical protein
MEFFNGEHLVLAVLILGRSLPGRENGFWQSFSWGGF